MWNEEVELLGDVMKEFDELNQPVLSFSSRRKLFCNQTNVGKAEYYFAAQNNMHPSLELEIHDFEYENEKFLFYQNQKYKILRTQKVDNVLKLICEGVYDE